MNPTKLWSVLFILFAVFSLQAQEITDYDLQNFARAYKDMVVLNTTAQKEMAKTISEEGLDLEVYHAIDASKNSDYEPDVPQINFTKYDKIQPKIQQIQNKLETDVSKAYTKHDLTKQSYTAIAERVKQDYMLQAKLEQIMAKMEK